MSKTERLAFINQSIQRYGFVTTQQVTEEFGVDKRTVRRDIEALKYYLDAPINFNRKRNRYEYEDVFKNLDFLDDQLLLFYCMVKAITSNDGYMPIKDELLSETIAKKIPEKYLNISSKIDFKLSEMETVKIDHFYAIFQCMIDDSPVILSYTDSKNKTTHREIYIVKLLNYFGIWYTVAVDCTINELRIFKLSRVIDIALIDNSLYTCPLSKHEIETYLNGTFGIFKGNKEVQVTLAFYGSAAQSILHQTWQGETKRSYSKEHESLTLSICAHDSDELIGKVLKYGADAEVKSPKTLRNRWLEEIEKMYKKFL